MLDSVFPIDAGKQTVTTEQKLGQEELADAIIRDCGDDPRAAVVAMLQINSALMVELHALAAMQFADAPEEESGLSRRLC
jgi:hypothetical protein